MESNKESLRTYNPFFTQLSTLFLPRLALGLLPGGGGVRQDPHLRHRRRPAAGHRSLACQTPPHHVILYLHITDLTHFHPLCRRPRPPRTPARGTGSSRTSGTRWGGQGWRNGRVEGWKDGRWEGNKLNTLWSEGRDERTKNRKGWKPGSLEGCNVELCPGVW